MIDKLKRKLFVFICYFIHSYQFLQGAYFLYIGGIKKPRIFAGYNHWWFACRYADKRSRLWKRQWDQSGKRQGVFPYSDTTLMTCSPGELRIWQKRKLIKIRGNARKLIKKAYYETV